MDLYVGEEESMTCAGGGCGVVVEKVLHVEGCRLGQLEKGVWAGWARQIKNLMGCMGLKMTLVLFLFFFFF
jgi:hypothetical protein